MSAAGNSWRDQLTAFLQREANPPHKFGHQPRLYRLSAEIAAATHSLHCDDDLLFAAAFLHDLGVFIGHRPEDPAALAAWDHVLYTCRRAPQLLTSFGFPAEKIDAVLACIREHQPHNTPHSPEATFLRDADILEQLGAIGVLRTASKLGSDNRFTSFTAARDALSNALNHLPTQLRLEASRALAAPRIATLRAFLEALGHEAGDHLG